jgi:hypothetical protein
MRYLMLVLSTPDAPADPGNVPEIEDWVRDTYGTGRAILGDRLRPPADAVGVQVRTKEVIAGFDILEAPDLDEAIRIAAAHPMAHTGAVELRPFWPLELDSDATATEPGAR